MTVETGGKGVMVISTGVAVTVALIDVGKAKEEVMFTTPDDVPIGVAAGPANVDSITVTWRALLLACAEKLI